MFGLLPIEGSWFLRFEKLLEESFRKSPRPSLPLKRTPPLISVFSPQGRRGKPLLLVARNRYAIRLAGHQSPRHVLRAGTAWQRLADTFVSGEKRNHGFREFTQIWTYASWDYIILVINHRTCYFKSRKNCGIERVVG